MSETAVLEPPKAKRISRAENKFEKQKKVVKQAIISATDQFRKKNTYDAINIGLDAQQIALNAELQGLHTYVSSDYGLRFAKMFTIALGKPFTSVAPPARTLTWVRFGAIMVKHQGGHNYPINKIVIVTQDQKGIREDGTIGNTMDNNHNYFFPATLEEINKITNETYAALIREFLVMA